MKKIYWLLLCILTGLLLFASWPPAGFPFLAFVAFVPLLFVTDQILENQPKSPFWNGVLYSYIAFFVWNVATTWWIWNITPVGSIATFALNSFFMSLVFGCWQRFRTLRFPAVAEAVCFIAFWSAWEFLHLNWDITWPWLNLGNVFANSTEFVQWYEFTGAFGGTLWILASNFLIYNFLKEIKVNRQRSWILSGALVLWIVLPIVGSIIRYSTYKLPDPTKEKSVEVVVVQQNTDPVEEQYSMSNLEHTQRILDVAHSKITPKTQLVVCAETAIPWSVSSDHLLNKTYPTFSENYSGFALFDTLTAQYPDLNLVIGLSTVKFFDHKATLTAHEIDKGRGVYVDSYNTSICWNRLGFNQMYYKSKLVPGVEKMPYPKVFGFLENLAIDLGGTSGSLGSDSVQRAFSLVGTDVKVGVPICYESAYGEHFGKFVRNGAQLMAVITNDGWWGNSPGHKQHFLFSKLRAVESRRTIMRSANTGISAIIDERGDAHQQTKYDTRLAIRENVCPNSEITFYTRHGDYLARFFTLLSAVIVAFAICWRIRLKIRKKIQE